MQNSISRQTELPSVISTRALTKEYSGVTALKSLNLNVPEHSIFGFLGPNGAGKTTTIKLLLGLARPTGGSGTIFGQDIVRDSLEIRKRVGYLAQAPRFYEHMTARETLRFKVRFTYSGPKAAIETRISETLELVGLSDRADRPIKRFSGGERQRLGIAQAQVTWPDLLILDEPAASLDPMGRRDVLEVMERLREHTTIFYSTHILDDVQRVSDTVAILDRGALGAGTLIVMVGIQGLLAYTQVSLARGEPLEPLPFLGSLGLLGLHLLFYLSLTLMLGTLFDSRAPVIGIPLAVFFGQSVLGSLVGTFVPWLPQFLPHSLTGQALSLALGQPLLSYIPITVTLFLLTAFVLAAIQRFARAEF